MRPDASFFAEVTTMGEWCAPVAETAHILTAYHPGHTRGRP